MRITDGQEAPSYTQRRMASSSRLRIALVALLSALAIAALLTLLSRDAADAASSPGASQTRHLLRLTDLPPGFAVFPIGSVGTEGGPPGPDMPCDALDAEPPSEIATFIRKRHPVGCFAAYLRLYTAPVPGPRPYLAGTGALDAGSVAGAREAFALAPRILGPEEDLERAPSPEPVGDESMLLRWEGALFRKGEVGTYLVWRSGPIVAVVLATSLSPAASERDALALARLQQTHVEHPTPYTAAERDDTEVALDNPKLQHPVYWLGREFAPGKSLPALRLEGTAADPAGGAFQNVVLYYAAAKSRSRLELDVVTREYWRQRKGLFPSPGRCARTKRLALPGGGHAVIYASYKGPTPTCPEHPPGVYFAKATIGRSVIIASLEATCANCGGPGGGPYNSFEGMAAILRGLEPRPKRVF